jgi:hypothetical protein
MPALSPLVAALLDLHFAQSSVGQAPGQAPGLQHIPWTRGRAQLALPTAIQRLI